LRLLLFFCYNIRVALSLKQKIKLMVVEKNMFYWLLFYFLQALRLAVF